MKPVVEEEGPGYPVDDFLGLREAAKRRETARRRSQRLVSVLSNAFLGLAALAFAGGLTVAAAAFAPRMGVSLPLDQMGLLGEVAASILPTSTPASDPGSLDPEATVGLPSPFPSPTRTLTPTATLTRTATATPPPSATPTITLTATITLTPSSTPIPSPTPTASLTPIGYQPPTATKVPTPTQAEFPNCEPAGNSEFEAALLALINEQRAAAGLAAYVRVNPLQAAARRHSTDMACNGFFSHTGSDGSSVGDRATAQGYEWSKVGQTIYATGDTSPEAPRRALEWWMASSVHRANLLSAEFVEVGIGYIHEPSSPFGGYFTAVFAQP